MANPQKENGFTSIANELFNEILKSDLTLRELKIVLCIIRFTYGFQRKEWTLSVRFISKSTNIKFQHISKTLMDLESKNIITFVGGPEHRQGRQIRLNKDYDSWLNSSRKSDTYSSQKGDTTKSDSSRKSDTMVPKKVTLTVPVKVTKKERFKENLKKEHEQVVDFKNSNSKQETNWRHRKRDKTEESFYTKDIVQKFFSREVNEADLNELNNIADKYKYGIETVIELLNRLTGKIYSTNVWDDEIIEATAQEMIYRNKFYQDQKNKIRKEEINQQIIEIAKEVIQKKEKVSIKQLEPENKSIHLKPIHLNLIPDFNAKEYANNNAY